MKFFGQSLLLIACLCSTQAFSQNNKIIFEEHFSDNSNKWGQFDTTWAKHKLDSGVYVIQRKNEYGNGEMRTISFDADRNFSLECSTKWRSGDKLTMYGIIFGFKDWDNNFGFLINCDGNYMCQNFYQGIDYSSTWKSSAVINKKGTNKLKVIKFGNWLTYYINDVFVDKMPYQQMLTSVFMMFVGGKQAIVFDDLVLKYCDKESYVSLFGEDEYNKMSAAYAAANDNSITLDQYIAKNYENKEGAFRENILFKDNFNNADRNWQTGTKADTVEQEIKDSAYYFEHFSDNAYSAFQKATINRNGNYTISISATWIKGTDDKGYGFIWGFSDWKNYKTFQISASGKYYISPYSQANKDWKPNNAIVKKGKNTLSVERKGRVCFFYINNVLVDSTAFTSLDGNTFGFCVDDRQKIKFDDVLVKEKLFIPKTTEKEVIFSENFKPKDNNIIYSPFYTRATMKLGMLDDGTEIYLKDNKFFFSHSGTNGHSKTAEVYISNDNDFTIEATMKQEKGEKGPAFGIVWGFKDWDNFNTFLISPEGAYRCSATIDKKEISDGWIKTGLIQLAAYNTLTIHKKGVLVEYYINGEMVAVLPYNEMRGYNHGYIVFGKQTISSTRFEMTEEKTTMPPFNKSNIMMDEQFFAGSKAFTTANTSTTAFQLSNGKCIVGNGPDTANAVKGTAAAVGKAAAGMKTNEGTRLTFQKVLSDLTNSKKNFRIDCVVEYKHEACELQSGDAQDSLLKYDLGAGLDIGGKQFLIYRNGNYSTTGEANATTATNGTWINRLTVEVFKGKIYYYINDMQVETQTLDNFKSNGLNLVIKGGNVWQYATFDDIVVRYL